jgi:predicted GIY-YIG superfamily endonuclease
MAELKWKEAVIRVLEEEKKALHYTIIAELIAEKGYRKSLGATPQDTVSAIMTTDINTNKEKSTFAKVDRGYYILRKFLDDKTQLLTEETEIKKNKKSKKIGSEKLRIVNSFGLYWNRNKVHWKTTPDLLGIQQIGATNVNFKNQIGIYLLHDSRETIYVGQAIEQSLGQRLRNHTTDRLSGRWDRFSWFGFFPVNDKGSLNKDLNFDDITIQDFGDILEAILIESIEPRQNRKQGNLFAGIEYLQQEAPEIKRRMKEQLIRELTDKL